MSLPAHDAALPLQKAIAAVLRGDAELTALVGARVYDMPPRSAVKPYVSFGGVQVLPVRGQDYFGADIAITLDAWSGQASVDEIGRIGRRLVELLMNAMNAEIALDDGQRVVDFAVENSQYLIEPDGLTRHASLTFRARTEPV